MKLEIDTSDYFSNEEMKKIAEDELRRAFRAQFTKEADVERVITNLSLEYVFALVAEQWDGDFAEALRDQVRKCFCQDTIRYEVFRRRDAWGVTESPAIAILDDECKNSRPLIKAAIEKHIAEYPFHELDRDEIGCVINDVIMNKILNPREAAQAGEGGE